MQTKAQNLNSTENTLGEDKTLTTATVCNGNTLHISKLLSIPCLMRVNFQAPNFDFPTSNYLHAVFHFFMFYTNTAPQRHARSVRTTRQNKSLTSVANVVPSPLLIVLICTPGTSVLTSLTCVTSTCMIADAVSLVSLDTSEPTKSTIECFRRPRVNISVKD